MAITEGTENNTPVVATVDHRALASALAHGLREAGIVGQQTAAPVRQSAFGKVFDSLKSNPDNDETSLNAIKNLIDAHGEDLKAEVESKSKSEFHAELQKQRDNHTINLIRLSLDSYIGDDGVLKEYLPMLQGRVIDRFNTEEKFAQVRARYGNGDVDVEVLKTLALEEVNKFNKARGVDQKTKSPTGMRSGGIQETAAMAADRGESDGDSKVLNPKGLDQQERDLFNASLGIAQKKGHHRDSKEALERASRAVLNLRNGRAQAKAKGLR